MLYLVGADDAPPSPTTCLEDWVRVPGDDRDLHARVAVLEMRAAVHGSPPTLDDDARLHYRGRRLTLSPPEERLASLLVQHFGEVVNDRELAAALRTDAASGSSPSLRTAMSRLRSRLRDLGLVVHRIRRRGYELQPRERS